MSVRVTNKTDCCGCTACAGICSHNAIKMVSDVLGFKYPEVNSNLCVECGLCEKVCAFNDHYDTSENLASPIPFGARHTDEETLMSSQSGGAFVALSDIILEQGGVVYGVGFADHFVATHKRATTKAERDEFKGSKYVQSDLKDTFRLVRQDLRDDKIVLFSGTPCQVAGLKSFIGERFRKNLFLVDIICHGVPSPFVFKDYLRYLEEKYNKHRIVNLKFRDKKRFGHDIYVETYAFDNNKIIHRYNHTYMFGKNVSMRQSCSSCYYCNTRRVGDVSIGDFWGWEKTNPRIYRDQKGCSLILCNTQKGLEWVRKIDSLSLLHVKLQNCLQGHLREASKLSPSRNHFEECYSKFGFEYVLKQFGTPTSWEVCKRQIRQIQRVLMKTLK